MRERPGHFDGDAPLTPRLARLYLALVLVRVGGVVLAAGALIIVLAFPQALGASAVLGFAGGLLVITAYFVSVVVALSWGRRCRVQRATERFTTLGLWPDAVEAAGLDPRRWSKHRLSWVLGITFLSAIVAVIAAVTLGDWSMSLR